MVYRLFWWDRQNSKYGSCFWSGIAGISENGVWGTSREGRVQSSDDSYSHLYLSTGQLRPFSCSGQKSWRYTQLFFSFATSHLLANSVASIFRIYLESNHFSQPLLLPFFSKLQYGFFLEHCIYFLTSLPASFLTFQYVQQPKWVLKKKLDYVTHLFKPCVSSKM